MHTLWPTMFLLAFVTGTLCDSTPVTESVSVKGQLIIADEREEVDSNQKEHSDDDDFDKLESFRIAREYLHRQIAQERNKKQKAATDQT
ncbi:hypothetical protein ANCCAN_05135 [Ancylostoma caninum]|uniref:Uncharacterized protein n=1 Tax=Ancylostoma caninum TaxID=29170 RepID=A0A368GWY4_ANCCA|nr:hypothetical protein ANCCAN_05135 [Ancylostoma caninum]